MAPKYRLFLAVPGKPELVSLTWYLELSLTALPVVGSW